MWLECGKITLWTKYLKIQLTKTSDVSPLRFDWSRATNSIGSHRILCATLNINIYDFSNSLLTLYFQTFYYVRKLKWYGRKNRCGNQLYRNGPVKRRFSEFENRLQKLRKAPSLFIIWTSRFHFGQHDKSSNKSLFSFEIRPFENLLFRPRIFFIKV